jgi:predicted PolB exonuclease-like 3'-5' exonuclease
MADIYSNVNENDFVDLREGLIRLTYYESILQDSVRVILYYADSGNTIDKDGKRLSALEGLPIVGQERVELAFEDNNKNKIEFTKEGKNNLYVNKVTP